MKLQWTGLCIFCIYMVTMVVTCTPTLTSSPGDCGEVTTLTCSSPEIVAGHVYQWFKLLPNKETIYDHTQTSILLNNKYNGSINNDSIVLQIHNMDEADTNVYMCNVNYTDSNNISLDVACRPTLTVSSGGCGGETILTCTSSAISTGDSYNWFKHIPTKTSIYSQIANSVPDKYNGTLQDGELTLRIDSTEESDINTYSCSYNFLESNNESISVDCSQTAAGSAPATINNYNSGKQLQSNVFILVLGLMFTTLFCMACYPLGS